MTYRVGRDWDTSKVYMSKAQALAAALKLGDDPCCIWKSLRGHWELIVDRSTPSKDRLPFALHITNVMEVAP
jgi:hypothetical protein